MIKVIRNLDLVVLALALPVFLIAGFPILGYVVAATLWILQRGVEYYARQRSIAALAEGNRRGAMGIVGATTLGRVWVMALAVLITGLIERQAGLAAAIIVAVLFTIHFATRGLTILLSPEETA